MQKYAAIALIGAASAKVTPGTLPSDKYPAYATGFSEMNTKSSDPNMEKDANGNILVKLS